MPTTTHPAGQSRVQLLVDGLPLPVPELEAGAGNREYWDEPCGFTRLAQLGAEASLESWPAIDRFDAFFFDFYPYLERLIPFGQMEGKRVLEVGLGMGSVSQRIARSGADFTGLDIAGGPVALVNRRLARHGLAGQALTGSILKAPFADESFDMVVSIGCLHHTGDLPRAIREVHRVLRRRGRAVLMLYYAYSPKRWLLWPRATLRHLVSTTHNGHATVEATAAERAGYDRASDGTAPPETVFTSVRQLRRLTRDFASVKVSLQNLDTDLMLYPVPRSARRRIRPLLLKLGRVMRTATEDMYVTLVK